MTDNTTEAGCNTPATGAVGSLVDQGVGRLFDEQGDFVDNKVTCAEVVIALKLRGLSTTAAALAGPLQTSSRAVATALRQATDDGRVRMTFKCGRAWYRFVRLTPRPKTPTKK